MRSALGTYYRLEAWDRLHHLNTHVRLKEKDVPLSDALASLSKRPSNVFPSEQQVRDVFATLGKTPSSETEAKLQEFVRYVREHGAKATPETEARRSSPLAGGRPQRSLDPPRASQHHARSARSSQQGVVESTLDVPSARNLLGEIRPCVAPRIDAVEFSRVRRVATGRP